MKVVEYISKYLERNAVHQVFGMSGANIEDLFSEIHNYKKTSIILAKNEYNAGTMAIGSYLSSKKIGVVLTTSGPGILNTIPVLAEAFASKIPLVIISGIIPIAQEGYGAFQDTSGAGDSFDLALMLAPCTTYQTKITDANEIPTALEMAFSLSQKNKRPAVILIPKDILSKQITKISDIQLSQVDAPILEDNSILINFCHKFIRDDELPPLVVLGEELIHLDDITSILEFISNTQAKVAVTPNSKGLYNHANSNFLGLIGIMGHDEVNQYLKQTKTVIIVGSDLSMLNRFGLESILSEKNILLIKEKKSASLYKVTDDKSNEVYGNMNLIFKNLNSFLEFKPISKINFKEKLLGNQSFTYQNIILHIQETLEDDGNIFIDAGNSGAFVIHHLQASGKGVCFVSLGMGGMGNSIGMGIGGAVASKKQSYIFLGDGSFLMHGLEIHTAIEDNLPVKVFIFNNNSHGMCSTRDDIFIKGETGINNFQKSYLATGIGQIFPGLASFEVSNIDELKSSLKEAMNLTTPCLFSINITNNENPPFKSFIKITEEII